VLWAPEIEAAVLDGLGLELEFPFEGPDLEALKFAVKYTFGRPASGHYTHGLQFISERLFEPELWELSLVYIPRIRISPVWSVLGMLGGRTTLEVGNSYHTEALINASVFAEFGICTTLGLETDIATDFSRDTNTLLMPQIHYEISDRWMIQGGAGVRLLESSSRPELGSRLIYTF
jgi:hypothetical protein